MDYCSTPVGAGHPRAIAGVGEHTLLEYKFVVSAAVVSDLHPSRVPVMISKHSHDAVNKTKRGDEQAAARDTGFRKSRSPKQRLLKKSPGTSPCARPPSRNAFWKLQQLLSYRSYLPDVAGEMCSSPWSFDTTVVRRVCI
ncbi:hypothetical protein EVAR_52083_1 [Eumeta japonica]|uniref:Uncharacterized protein n=1 Tax=Eumeta variegata TaxID=151549 RepID=A0A4C1Y126_EUMVA|nr:hypothetical protein EVAR_52083_1 [Eumeta japonica]